MQRFNCFFISALKGRQSLGLGLGCVKFGRLILRQSSSGLSQEPAAPKRDPLSNVYETDRLVNQYMAFHYAEERNYFKYDFGPKDHLGFPKRCARLCIEHMKVCALLILFQTSFVPEALRKHITISYGFVIERSKYRYR